MRLYLKNLKATNITSEKKAKKSKAEDVAQSVECLPTIKGALGLISALHNHVVAHDKSRHAGGGDRKIKGSKSSFGTWGVGGQPGVCEILFQRANPNATARPKLKVLGRFLSYLSNYNKALYIGAIYKQ